MGTIQGHVYGAKLITIRDFLFGDSSPTGYVDANDQPIALNDAR
jgi:hypothetical protein